MGRIYKRGKSWYADERVGRRRVRLSAGRDRRGAKRLAEDIRYFGEEQHTLLEEVCEDYVAELRARARPRTIEWGARQAEVLQAHFGADFDCRQLAGARVAAEHVQGFIAAQRAEGREATTINGRLKFLKAACRHAEIAAWVKLLRTGRQEPSFLEDDECALLVETARKRESDGELLALMLLLAWKAGLRRSEIRHLKVRDIDFRRGRVRVARKSKKRDGVDWLPKAHHERSIPMAKDGALYQAARRFLAFRKADEWVFPGEYGRPVTNTVPDRLRQVWEAAGLYAAEARPGLHQLRRSWATGLAADGCGLPELMRMGGWANLKTVESYLGASDARQEAAIARRG